MMSGTVITNSNGSGIGIEVRKMQSKEELSTTCPHCEDEFLTREKMISHAVSCDYRTWTHETWSLICPKCSERRMLWPINQPISSLDDPKAKFIHHNGWENCS